MGMTDYIIRLIILIFLSALNLYGFYYCGRQPAHMFASGFLVAMTCRMVVDMVVDLVRLTSG